MSGPKLPSIPLTFLLIAGIFGHSAYVLGQGEQIPSDRPSARQRATPEPLSSESKPNAEFSLPPVPPPQIANQADRLVNIQAYSFEGNTVFDNDTLQSIAAPYVQICQMSQFGRTETH